MVQDAKTKDERLELIKKHNCLALRDILKGGLDDSITWIIPLGSPPFKRPEKETPIGLTPSNLHRSSSKLRYFIAGGPGEKLQPTRREKLFIDLLESIHVREADLVIAMKDKQLKKLYPCLTKQLIKSAYQTLIVK